MTRFFDSTCSRWVLFLLVLVGIGSAGACTKQKSPDAQPELVLNSVTRSFVLDHNRIIVEVELISADGRARAAKAWVDTGTDALIVSETVARDIGLDTSPLDEGDGHGSVESHEAAPEMRLGGWPLATEGVPLRIYPGSSTNSGIAAEVHLPAAVFRSFHVVFDYQELLLTVAVPGALEPRGTATSCRVNPGTGLFLIETTVDGETVVFGVDTGSAGTWVSNNLVSSWRENHPDWLSVKGAAGSTNFFGFDFEVDGTLMSLPEIGIGSVKVDDVAVLGLGQGLFDWYSRKSAGPVAGFVGGNVLRQFRLEVHWPEQRCFWEAGSASYERDLNIVGLTLRPGRDGSYTVAAVVEKEGKATVEDVRAGDLLLKIDGLETFGATMGTVVDALRGKPGDIRVLLLERDGERFSVEAVVQHLG